MKKQNCLPGRLRQYRTDTGMTCEQVVARLKAYDIDLSSKTLSGYENGVSSPNVITFLSLCDIYGISDIMERFGYDSARSSYTLNPTEAELVQTFRSLNPLGQEEALDHLHHLSEKDAFKKEGSSAGPLPAVN